MTLPNRHFLQLAAQTATMPTHYFLSARTSPARGVELVFALSLEAQRGSDSELIIIVRNLEHRPLGCFIAYVLGQHACLRLGCASVRDH
jgi:hypothetical protein